MNAHLARAACYLGHGCDNVISEALKDVAIADKSQPEKKNEISKLRVNINRAKLRLRALARRAETLSKQT